MIPKRQSVLQERRVAEELGGKVQPGSGAPQFYKGDVRVAEDIRVECKTTGAKAYRLTVAELQKIQMEALTGGEETWAMQIQFQGQFTNKKYAVIDWDTFVQLRQDAKK